MARVINTSDTQVFPVQVTYTQRWWSSDRVLSMNGVAIDGCYDSTLSTWICSLNASVKKEPMLSQPRR
jgi:hypothetical protein